MEAIEALDVGQVGQKQKGGCDLAWSPNIKHPRVLYDHYHN